MTSFQPIRGTTVVQEIIERFKQALMRGELRPGQRLPSQEQLAGQLGVGLTALRQAMSVLEALGVVRIGQGDGSYVRDQMSPTLLNPLVFAMLLEVGLSAELLELRLLIETGYCELAALKATPEDWKQIEEAAEAWERYARSSQPNLDTLAQLDLAFHSAILRATHNALVIKIGLATEELFLSSIQATLSKTEGLEWGIGGHRALLDALHAGDSESIRGAVSRGLEYWEKEVTALLAASA